MSHLLQPDVADDGGVTQLLNAAASLSDRDRGHLLALAGFLVHLRTAARWLPRTR